MKTEIKNWENYSTYIQDLKIIPEWKGYLLCKCSSSSVREVERFFYYLNKNTTLRIGRFLPEPVSPLMIKNLLAKIQTEKKPKESKLIYSSSQLKEGDWVIIKEGMLVNKKGQITHLNKRSQKVKIRVEDSGIEVVNIPLDNCQKWLKSKF